MESPYDVVVSQPRARIHARIMRINLQWRFVEQAFR